MTTVVVLSFGVLGGACCLDRRIVVLLVSFVDFVERVSA